MNTSFLKALVPNQRRAQVVGQILCLMVVAAIFVLSPLVALAGGCGQNNAQQQAQQAIKKAAVKTGSTVQVVGVVDTFAAGTAAPNALNLSTVNPASLPAGTKLAGSTTIKGASLADVTPGAWILMTQNGVTYAATFFGCNNQKVCELWPAEPPVASDPSLKITKLGTKIFVNENQLGLLPNPAVNPAVN